MAFLESLLLSMAFFSADFHFQCIMQGCSKNSGARNLHMRAHIMKYIEMKERRSRNGSMSKSNSVVEAGFIFHMKFTRTTQHLFAIVFLLILLKFTIKKKVFFMSFVENPPKIFTAMPKRNLKFSTLGNSFRLIHILRYEHLNNIICYRREVNYI